MGDPVSHRTDQIKESELACRKQFLSSVFEPLMKHGQVGIVRFVPVLVDSHALQKTDCIGEIYPVDRKM